MIQKRPIVLILNGASSAGKTLTAEALVKLLGQNCVVTGLDDILAREQPFGAEGKTLWQRFNHTLRVMQFQMGDGRFQLFQKLHREIVAHYQAGRDVIVESALMDPRALADAAQCFADLNAFFIGLKPPLAVSEQWEASRDDRPVGQARKHYELIHAHHTYDLLLDPSTMTPDACTAAILDHVAKTAPFAWGKLREKNNL